jgi:hypothetical protein
MTKLGASSAIAGRDRAPFPRLASRRNQPAASDTPGGGWTTANAQSIPNCTAWRPDPSRYSVDELRLLYAAIARQVGTFVYSNRAGEVMRDIRDVGRDGGRQAVQLGML